MHSYSRKAIIVLFASVFVSACNRLPDHMRYIPKDAVAVAGVNLKSLSKKIAWNLITGSKLFKEMQKRLPEKSTKDAMSGIEKAGIDVLNTFYVYVKTDTRFKGGNRITGLVPLSDAGQWENYVRQVFPNVAIKEKGDRKEASLGSDMYVGWNKHLLVVINVSAVSAGEDGGSNGGRVSISSQMGSDDMSAEMENAFSVTKENSIVGNTRFTQFEAVGHDVTFWLNYEELMNEYGGDMAEKMGGISLSATSGKGAAFTAGVDFVQGKITSDMQLFFPDSMSAIGAEFGSVDVDKDLVDRLPGQNMDLALVGHLSPQGIKSSLEKMGLLGLANVGLETQGFNVDSVLGAFTGDVAIVINALSLKTEKVSEPFMGNMVVHDVQKQSMTASLVMKLNKKENFQGLLKFAQHNGVLPTDNGMIVPIDDKDSVYMQYNDQYAVVSNKLPYVSGMLSGAFKSQKKSAELLGNPWAVYLDMQELFTGVDPAINQSASDSVVIVESKKLLSNICFSGGKFKDNSLNYHLDINFVNTEENSIIEIMDFGMKISDALNAGK